MAEVSGEVIEVDDGYGREEGIGWNILLPILIAAGVGRVPGLLVEIAFRTSGSGGARRSIKDLRKGPEFLVTPFVVRDIGGVQVALEVHGHLSSSALMPGDHIVATVRPQRRADLPPRAYRVDNYTSGRAHSPHPPTRWTHIGPPLIVNAALGVVIIFAMVGLVLLAKL
jgi:hypothetical protein